MARDGSGGYSLPQAAFVSGSTIESAKVNSNFSDIASALAQSISKDGQTTPTANQPMATFRHTGVGAATARTDYARADQVIGSVLDYAIDTGSADAYAIAPSPGISAYVVGQRFAFKVINANLTTTPTLNVNSIGAGVIKYADASALAAGDMPAGALVEVIVAATTPVFHLQTQTKPALNTSTGLLKANNLTDVSSTSTALANLGGTSGGFVNKLHNGSFVAWPNGTSGSVTTSATGTAAITAGRWAAIATGATITWAQDTTVTNGSPFSLKLTGNTSVTDIVLSQRIEAAESRTIAGKRVTFQASIYNNTGGSITPTIATRYAGANDDFTTPSSDIAATNLQACANGSWTTVAYTFDVSASATTGYEIKIDFGNNFGANTKYVRVAAADLRVTPGLTTGTNSTPPSPEFRDAASELARCSRYFQASYDNGTTPGTSTALGLVGGGQGNGVVNSIVTVYLSPAMRAAPTIAYWDKAGNASKYSTGNNNSFTDNVGALTVQNASTRAFEIYQSSSGTAHIHYTAYADFW